ncbi:MAG: EVE domain-containing protein [Alphaproteobacteria bacterium]|nr:EVE domain-containing protein [Alphaproteobacteria bacterium]
MAYWLLKTEPETWSWDDQVKNGRTHWEGVRNFQAASNLKAMRVGERCWFYHSGGERAIVGVVAVARTYYPDPSDPRGRFGMVDVTTLTPVGRRVTLAEIKADPAFADFALVRQARLSVIPVADAHWQRLCRMTDTQA